MKAGKIILIIIPAVLAGVMCTGLKKEQLELVLTCTRVEITVGESFDAMAYVKAYEAGRGELVLPQVDTAKPGTQMAVYRVIDQDEKIEKILYVEVVE